MSKTNQTNETNEERIKNKLNDVYENTKNKLVELIEENNKIYSSKHQNTLDTKTLDDVKKYAQENMKQTSIPPNVQKAFMKDLGQMIRSDIKNKNIELIDQKNILEKQNLDEIEKDKKEIAKQTINQTDIQELCMKDLKQMKNKNIESIDQKNQFKSNIELSDNQEKYHNKGDSRFGKKRETVKNQIQKGDSKQFIDKMVEKHYKYKPNHNILEQMNTADVKKVENLQKTINQNQNKSLEPETTYHNNPKKIETKKNKVAFP